MFKERLNKCRLERGLSQSAVANLLNMTRQAYNHYETGQRQPTQEILVKIADLFQVSVDYLLGRTDDPYQMDGETNIKYDEFSYAMYDEAKDLSEDDKKRLLMFARMLKDSTIEEKKNDK